MVNQHYYYYRYFLQIIEEKLLNGTVRDLIFLFKSRFLCDDDEFIVVIMILLLLSLINCLLTYCMAAMIRVKLFVIYCNHI